MSLNESYIVYAYAQSDKLERYYISFAHEFPSKIA